MGAEVSTAPKLTANAFTVPAWIGPFAAMPVRVVAGEVDGGVTAVSLPPPPPPPPQPDSTKTVKYKTGQIKLFLFMDISLSVQIFKEPLTDRRPFRGSEWRRPGRSCHQPGGRHARDPAP